MDIILNYWYISLLKFRQFYIKGNLAPKSAVMDSTSKNTY